MGHMCLAATILDSADREYFVIAEKFYLTALNCTGPFGSTEIFLRVFSDTWIPDLGLATCCVSLGRPPQLYETRLSISQNQKGSKF